MDDVFARYQAALRAAHQLAADGKFKDALSRYEEAARVADQRALPQIGIGGMLLRLGKPKDALVAYERALALEPDNLDALSGRAAAFLAAGKRSQAASVQQQIVSLRAAPPTRAGVAQELLTPLSRAETLAIAGEQARDAGRPETAIDAWLSEAREHAAAQRFDAALDAAMRALSLDTGSARAHLALTRVCFERGWNADGTERSASLRRLLELAPDDDVSAGLDELELRYGGGSATA
jgi:tetratricopeptide (TPR) repeat protein